MKNFINLFKRVFWGRKRTVPVSKQDVSKNNAAPLTIEISSRAVTTGAGVVVGNDIIPFDAEIERVIWEGMYDEKTCLECGDNIGKSFKIGEFRPSLPVHMNCRCWYEPVLPGQEGEGKLYSEWLKTQPLKVIQEVLGEERGKLFFDNEVDWETMIKRTPHELERVKLLNLEALRKKLKEIKK